MRHLILIFLLLTFSTTLFADKFVVKSFKRIDNKILLNKDKRTDDNDELCGIVLVRTSLVGLGVSASTPVVGNVKRHEGDNWVYLSEGTQMIKFFKDGFVTYEYKFPERIEKGRFYLLELEYQRTEVTGAVNTMGFVVINSEPAGADVYVNNEPIGMQTPYQNPYNEGFYRFMLKKPLYDDYKGNFTVKQGETQKVNVILVPNFGNLVVSTTPELHAAVTIDGIDQPGKTPLTIKKLKPGKHTVRLAKSMYLTKSLDITIEKGKDIPLQIKLQPNFAYITVKAQPGDEIYIDDRKKGEGTLTQPLLKGRHIIEIKRNNYYSQSKEINIVPGQDLTQTFTLKPKTGTLSVMSTPIGAEIYVNGEDKGVAPRFINNLITGNYTVQLKKQGFGTLTKTVTIAENKTTTLNVTLPTGKEVTINSNPQGATLFVDGINSGTTPKTLTLSFGNHTLKLINGKKTVTQTIAVTQTGKTSWQIDVREFKNYTETCCGLNLEMVRVPGGTFEMGDNIFLRDGVRPVHTVTVNGFYMGKYEVTQKQWKAVMGYNPSNHKGDNLPVEEVSWNDVQKFLKKLNEKTGKHYYLPTEAEWEYAARGGNRGHGYKYSGSNKINKVAWYGGGYTHQVGTKAPNELGLYDMSGNVSEWCNDWYNENYYSHSPQNNPQGPVGGKYRVLRGGSWNYIAVLCRVACRNWVPPGGSNRYSGFRVVR